MKMKDKTKQILHTLSRYLGIRSANACAVAGETSEGLTIAQFPAVMAPINGQRTN